jgi:hypothetical protein
MKHVFSWKARFGVVALFGATVITIASPSSAVNAELFSLPATDECLSCSTCQNTSQHTAPGPVDTGNAFGIAHSHCSAIGDCSFGHFHDAQTCSGFALKTLPALWKDIAAADGDKLRQVISGYGAVVSYNTQRQAVQVLGCSGVVIAHIPLSQHQIAALAL